MSDKTEVVIFSAEKSSKTKQVNGDRTKELKSFLDTLGINYKECIGKYKEQLETSLMIARSDFDKTLQQNIFKSFNQESVLFIDSERRGYLLYPGNQKEYLGALQKYSPGVALKKDFEAFTITGKFAYTFE